MLHHRYLKRRVLTFRFKKIVKKNQLHILTFFSALKKQSHLRRHQGMAKIMFDNFGSLTFSIMPQFPSTFWMGKIKQKQKIGKKEGTTLGFWETALNQH